MLIWYNIHTFRVLEQVLVRRANHTSAGMNFIQITVYFRVLIL